MRGFQRTNINISYLKSFHQDLTCGTAEDRGGEADLALVLP